MGNNTLETITGGIGRKEQVNQYKEALVGDILPRNLNGEVEDHAAGLGSEFVRFLGANIDMIRSNGLLLTGADKSQTFLASGTFTIPKNAGSLTVVGCGAGGSGGSGSGSGTFGGGGGGGGGGGFFILELASYSEAETIAVGISGGSVAVTYNAKTVSASSGGGGGASSTSNSLPEWYTSGGAGGAGGSVINSGFSILEFIVAKNGGGGGAGAVATNGIRGTASESQVGKLVVPRSLGGTGFLSYGNGGAGGGAGASGAAGTGFSGQSAGALILWKEPA